jgi:hypothetical protein
MSEESLRKIISRLLTVGFVFIIIAYTLFITAIIIKNMIVFGIGIIIISNAFVYWVFAYYYISKLRLLGDDE